MSSPRAYRIVGARALARDGICHGVIGTYARSKFRDSRQYPRQGRLGFRFNRGQGHRMVLVVSVAFGHMFWIDGDVTWYAFPP